MTMAQPKPPALPTVATDRRRFQRHELLAQVRVRHGVIDFVLEIANLSCGGALVDFGSMPRPSWLTLRCKVDVRVLHTDGRALIESPARVVRIEESLERCTFAVEFEVTQPESVVKRAMAGRWLPPPLPRKSL